MKDLKISLQEQYVMMVEQELTVMYTTINVNVYESLQHEDQDEVITSVEMELLSQEKNAMMVTTIMETDVIVTVKLKDSVVMVK